MINPTESLKNVPANRDLFLRWKDAGILLTSQGSGIVQSDIKASEHTLKVWEEMFQENLNKLSAVFVDTKLYIMEELKRED